MVGHGNSVLVVGAGGDCLDLSYLLSLFLSLGGVVGWRDDAG